MIAASDDTRGRAARAASWIFALLGAATIVVGAGAATHVLVAPVRASELDASLPEGAPTIDLVLVRADTERLIGETADGSFVTVEFRGPRGAAVSSAVHEFTHGTSAQVIRVALEQEGDRRFAVGVEPGPSTFPGVDRAPSRDMDRETFEEFQLGTPRNDVVAIAGPPHVPGIDQGFEGARADCFDWHAADRDGSYRLCFDQSSAPRLLGRSTVG